MSVATDISLLPSGSINDHTLTSHIASRFHQGMPYITISTGTLVAVNTFSPFDINQEQNFKDLAARAYNRLCKRGENQVIVFLGETGSGKSDFRDSLAGHLLTLANNPLSTKIKNADAIFSAFTTTKTLTSLSASRAGHVLELQYGKDATLIGANILDYRLERARVTNVPTAERNFHVFYYLIAGMSDSEREHLALEDVHNARYKYLGHHTQMRIDIDDKAKFTQLKSAFRALEFSRADIANICQVLAAIIHIGQLTFRSTGSDGTRGPSTLVDNVETLEYIASFLGVRSNLLENALSYKTVYIKNDRVTLVLDQKGARENADELARALYTLLFVWVMEQINSSLSQDRNASVPGLSSIVDNTISVVDFPGFSTSSSVPTIDKLLHNSANEILYNYLLKSYFETPIEKFNSEEVVVPQTEYFDNSDTVRTLFRHSLGALSVIDDYSRRDKSDNDLMESFRKRYDQNPSLDAISSRRSFTVRHFAGEVEYMVDNLLSTNSEIISGDIINLFTSSSSSDFLQAVFSSSAVVDSKFGSEVVQAHLSSKPLRAPSVVRRGNSTKSLIGKPPKKKKSIAKANACGQFVNAIDSLIESFQDANPYFVLCLKPNDRKLPNQFDARCVRQQIQAFGIPEICKRVKITDFSVFLPFNEFIRYANAEGNNNHIDDFSGMNISEHNLAVRLIQSRGWPERDARYGLSGVFLSEQAWLQLVDPKMSFAENANNLFLEAGNRNYNPNNMGDNDAYYFDPDSKSLAPTSGGGNMFRFNDSKSANKDALIHTKDGAEENQIDEVPVTRARKAWMFVVWMLTWWIPDFFIRILGKMPRKDIRIAWREKLAINMLIWVSCCCVILLLVGFPILICPTQHVYTQQELKGYSYNNNPNKVYGSIRGAVLDLTQFAPSHYPSVVPTRDVLKSGGGDMSDMFPIQISALCNGVNGTVDPNIVLGSAYNYSNPNAQYHDFRNFKNDSRPDWYYERMKYLRSNYLKGHVGFTPKNIKALVSDQRTVAILNGYLYDITQYVIGDIQIRAPDGVTVDKSSIDTNFMAPEIISLMQSNNGKDITKQWQNLNIDKDLRNNMEGCLNQIFMIGKEDTRGSVKCLFARYFLLAISMFAVFVILIKFIAALQFTRKTTPEDNENFMIMQVPAYTEDEDSLRRAMDSLARTKYDDKRKLLVVICDGMIIGAGNDRPTPRIVLDIVGHAKDIDPPALSFESLGEGNKQHNMGKIYSGLYEVQGHIVPYIILVKVGKPTEINRPGNRGKRDSQMLLMRFLNRVHHNLPMNPFELELYHQIQNIIGVNPAYYEFLMQVDADTVVSPESCSQFASVLHHNNKIQAICGETGLSNAKASIVTMMQVYEYFISHNLAKAFESLFGSVTCLPGCFSMYRIYQPGTGKPVFISHPIVQDYAENRVDTLHMKNLLHLGEDRYLTTLLLKHNPNMATKYLSIAHANTIAPDTWSVFLSQRRRWINSTVHNLCELLPLSQLCGFCCFSMRFIVILDLLSTIIQPVTVGYLVYLFYLIGSSPSNIPVTSIILLAAVYGLQALVFIVRRKWEMIGWMFFYLMAIPLFSLYIPLYAFWYMDDFSWGNTRVVLGEKGKKIVISTEGAFDPSEIPMQTWQDYQSDAWNNYNEMYQKMDNESIAPTYAQSHQDVLAKSVYSMQLRPGSTMGSEMGSVYGATPAAAASRSAFTNSNTTESGDIEMGVLKNSSSSNTNNLANANLPSDDAITSQIREILSTADLMTVTKRSIRQHLERHFGVKLSAKRDYINYVTEAILTDQL